MIQVSPKMGVSNVDLSADGQVDFCYESLINVQFRG